MLFCAKIISKVIHLTLRKSKYKDLNKWRQTKRLQKQRYRERLGNNKYPRRNWTKEEDLIVLQHNIPDRELSKKLKRSISSIQSRRLALKHDKLQPHK